MRDSPISVLSDAGGNLVTTAPEGASIRRLHVDTRGSAVPGSNIINKPLLNGTSASMVVNGGTTSVSFSYAPTSGQSAVIQSINIIFTFGAFAFNGPTRFLNAGAMTVGIAYYVTINGAQTIFSVYKANEDFLSLNTSVTYFAPSAGGLLGGGVNGLLSCALKTSIPLSGATGDSCGILIRDNLTSTGGNLVAASSTCQGYTSS